MKKYLPAGLIFTFILVLIPSYLEAGELVSEVRLHKGIPALFVNGRLTSQVLGAPYRTTEADFKDFLDAGISIFSIYLRFDWTGPEQYDFTKVDDKLAFFLKLAPDALFLPRILLTPGEWWCKEFPDEITMRDDGSPAGMFRPACHPSLASHGLSAAEARI